MSGLTPEQQDVVSAPMVPLCVIACAGSGKTNTAVHRVVQMRRNLGKARGRVALLSFSNVAVDAFRRAFDDLASNLPSSQPPFTLKLSRPLANSLRTLAGALGSSSCQAIAEFPLNRGAIAAIGVP